MLRRMGISVDRRHLALAGFCLATVLLIPMAQYVPGGLVTLVSGILIWRTPDPTFQRRMSVLLGTVVWLALAPIETRTDNLGYARLVAFFGMAIIVPVAIFRKYDPGLIDFRLWPHKFRWLDIFYVGLAVPLAYVLIRWYFFTVNLEMPVQWFLPAEYDAGETWRLVIGLNSVGIWDELFFVNIMFCVLRSMFSFRIANLAQAVVYTSVLYDMAFIGIGPALVYFFALTQGSMYEQAKCLLYVLIVHLVIDAFLLESIIEFYYPTHGSFHWF